MNAATPALVEVDSVRQLYPKGSGENLLVLDDVTLKLGNNEIVSLLGRSGCGKSTLLRIIAGFETATAGAVEMYGAPIAAPGPERGMVFQDYTSFDHRTVLDNVTFGLECQGNQPPQHTNFRPSLVNSQFSSRSFNDPAQPTLLDTSPGCRFRRNLR
jgi:NitT/TauT family transport system ATP-binding protein